MAATGFPSASLHWTEFCSELYQNGLRNRLLNLAHYPRLVEHPGKSRKYFTLRREYSSPQTANDAFSVAPYCDSYAKTRGTVRKLHKYMRLFPAPRP